MEIVIRAALSRRSRVIFFCSSAATRDLGVGIVLQPLAQHGEHLGGAAPGGADDEDVAEAIFVGAVALGQRGEIGRRRVSRPPPARAPTTGLRRVATAAAPPSARRSAGGDGRLRASRRPAPTPRRHPRRAAPRPASRTAVRRHRDRSTPARRRNRPAPRAAPVRPSRSAAAARRARRAAASGTPNTRKRLTPPSGIDVQPDVRRRDVRAPARPRTGAGDRPAASSAAARRPVRRSPASRRRPTRRRAASFITARLDAGGVGIVALEVRRVELDARGSSPAMPELDDGPVVSRPAAPLRLPAVAHVRRRDTA